MVKFVKIINIQDINEKKYKEERKKVEKEVKLLEKVIPEFRNIQIEQYPILESKKVKNSN